MSLFCPDEARVLHPSASLGTDLSGLDSREQHLVHWQREQLNMRGDIAEGMLNAQADGTHAHVLHLPQHGARAGVA